MAIIHTHISTIIEDNQQDCLFPLQTPSPDKQLWQLLETHCAAEQLLVMLLFISEVAVLYNNTCMIFITKMSVHSCQFSQVICKLSSTGIHINRETTLNDAMTLSSAIPDLLFSYLLGKHIVLYCIFCIFVGELLQLEIGLLYQVWLRSVSTHGIEFLHLSCCRCCHH